MAHSSPPRVMTRIAAIGVQRRGVRMDGRAARQLAGFAAVQRNLEQLGVAGAVAGEKHFPIAGEKRALQKVRRVIDVRAVGDLRGSCAAQVEIAAGGESGDLAVGNGALEHPEAAIGMDPTDASLADDLFGALDARGRLPREFRRDSP